MQAHRRQGNQKGRFYTQNTPPRGHPERSEGPLFEGLLDEGQRSLRQAQGRLFAALRMTTKGLGRYCRRFFVSLTPMREGRNPSRCSRMSGFLENWMGPCLRRDDLIERLAQSTPELGHSCKKDHSFSYSRNSLPAITSPPGWPPPSPGFRGWRRRRDPGRGKWRG